MLSLHRISRKIKVAGALGLVSLMKYLIARNGKVIRLKICSDHVYIRKGTPDLSVAISCLVDKEFDAVKKSLPADYSGIIVDAGGYIGTAAIALSKLFPAATVLAIEPSERNAEILRLNIKTYPSIRLVFGALVADAGRDVVLKDRGTGHWGYTVVDSPADGKEAAAISRVPTVSLADLVSGPESIGLLKLDIEGAEKQLFDNEAEFLAKINCIIVELHDRIQPGCTESFSRFSIGRDNYRASGEKWSRSGGRNLSACGQY